jgi:hypothetical protein
MCNIRTCPVTLLRFPDDEEDFRDPSFAVAYKIVLERFELETGIGSSMPFSAEVDIFQCCGYFARKRSDYST